MLLKALVLSCLLALALAQSESTCDDTSFFFYNNFGNAGENEENVWDWVGANFDDGGDDVFDGYFFTDVVIDGVSYSVSNYYSPPADYFCDIGNTSMSSESFASYTYNITDTVQLHREFYAPRAASWIRVVDTLRNYGSTAINVTLTYVGTLGSNTFTKFHELNQYYWVTSDGENGSNDPPFSHNVAGLGAMIFPVYDNSSGKFYDNEDDVSFSYYGIIVSPSGSESIMQVLGIYGNLATALAGGQNINANPVELLSRLSVSNLVNWDLCMFAPKVGMVEDMQTAYCTTPSMVTMTIDPPTAMFFVDNQPVTVTDGKVMVQIVNGENMFSTQLLATCAPTPMNYTFKVVTANLSIAIDNTGALPAATATGGFGSYEYSWKFPSSGDLNGVFGAQATVTVEDAEGCTASKEVNIPTLQQNTPVAATPQKKTSSAARLIGSLIGLTAAIIAM